MTLLSVEEKNEEEISESCSGEEEEEEKKFDFPPLTSLYTYGLRSYALILYLVSSLYFLIILILH